MKRLLLVTLLALAAAGCARPLTQGVIVGKEHRNPSTSLGIAPVFGGKQTSWALTTDYSPERWVFVVDGSIDGDKVTRRVDVDRYEWERAKVGDSWRKTE